MRQEAATANKWAERGWRIEKAYSNKVLIGNWAEERLQFTREPKIANSTARVDYRPHWDFKPDVSARTSALLRAEGLPSKLLFGHAGPPSSRHLVTLYGESYGRPDALPALRPRQADGSGGRTERSDRPISALPTKCGPLRSTNSSLKERPPHLQPAAASRSAYSARDAHLAPPARVALPGIRTLSSRLHAPNHKKDRDLRRRLL